MKHISLLGATGSIGTQTLQVIREHPEEFSLTAMAFGRNVEYARKIINTDRPELVCVETKEDCDRLKSEFPTGITFVWGEEGLIQAAAYEKADIVLNSVLGSIGLQSTLAAIEAKKTVALANKESLVVAGHLVKAALDRHKVDLIPVDSEHSAIFQCLRGEDEKTIQRLLITASGGSFRDYNRKQLENVTLEQALNHPNWSMGSKITIDSATMMNKGLEVIEAHWLFDMPYDKIDVLLHRESIIHSLVEFQDSSVMAQLGSPDMRVPIQLALSYPDRLPLPSANWLDLVKTGTLHFEEMDMERFRCLQFAYDAGREGGTMPAVLNAANEVAVAAFLKEKISFLQIESIIETVMNKHKAVQNPDLETIHQADKEARAFASTLF